MAVNETLSAYSTVAAGNTPSGSDNIGPDLDNHLRDIKKNLRLAAENAQGTNQPEGFQGRFWLDTSDTASNAVTLNIHDGGAFTSLFDIEDSAHHITSANFALSAIPGTQIDLGGLAASAIAASSVDFTGLSGSAIARAAIDGLGTTVEQDVGTAVGNVPQLISGSATSTPALPTLSGENLNALKVGGAQIDVATQAEMEAASANTVAALATAGNIKHSAFSLSFWGKIVYSAGVPSVAASANISGVTDSGVGVVSVGIDADMADGDYAITTGIDPTNDQHRSPKISNQLAGSFALTVVDNAGGTTDPNVLYFMGAGDLA